MDRVRRKVTAAKRDVPVDEKPTSAFGKLKGAVRIKRDAIRPIGEKWGADRY